MERRPIIAERFEILDGARTPQETKASRVHRARDLSSGALVALKVLEQGDDLDEERLRREAHVLRELDSPLFVRLVDHGHTEGGRTWLATEWLEGEDLAERLARAPLEVGESLALVRRLAEAMGLAHARGVVHRDLKPSNVFLEHSDVHAAKVIDFGIARKTRETRRWTEAGTLLGTPGYMAPEQAQGLADVDARADVFSLGCILYECLSGAPPFGGGSAMNVLSRVLLEDAPRLSTTRPELGAAIDALVARSLSRRREDRPANGVALAEEFAALGDASGGGPPRITSATLGFDEQRVVSVLLVAMPDDDVGASPSRTAASLENRRIQSARRLGRLGEPHGAWAAPLADDLFALTVPGASYVGDEATALARAALAVRAEVPGSMVILTTGRAHETSEHVVGEVMDRGVRMLGRAREDAIIVDETSAMLLQGRFRVSDGVLVGERRGADVLSEAACFGRDRELALLDAALAACAAEQAPRAVVVVAPPGGGKSFLRDAWLARIVEREEDVELMLGACGPGAPAYALAGDIVRRAAGVMPGDSPRAQAEKLAARLGKLPDPAERTATARELGELVASVLPRSAQGSTGQWSAPRAHSSFEAHFLRWLECECALGPVALIVEELQWADAASVALLSRALDVETGSSFLLVGLARPELSILQPDLWRDRNVQELRIGPLPPKSSLKLLASEVEAGPPSGLNDEALLAAIAARAEGHPFLLRVLGRAAQTLPDAVLGFLQPRLLRVSPEARRAVRACALVGPTFDRREVELLLPRGAPLAEMLAELVRGDLIEAAGPGDRYKFRSALLHGAADRSVTNEDRDLALRILANARLESAAATDAVEAERATAFPPARAEA